MERVQDAVRNVEGRLFIHSYLDHTKANMPGDDHPGARFTQPQVRVWDGNEPATGNVVAEAYLNESHPGLIVAAWASGADSNATLVDCIGVWASQHGCQF
jgi:hypothetical protein